MNPNDYHFISSNCENGPYLFREIREHAGDAPRYEWSDRRFHGGRWVPWPMPELPPEVRPARERWAAEYATLAARRESEAAWARDWFAGAASCPRCSEEVAIERIDRDSDDGSTIETWGCACGGRWRVELRESALLVEQPDRETHDPDDWIERDASGEALVRLRAQA